MNYWAKSRDFDSFPAFTGKKKIDVCIVGGGIFGVSTALELQKAGRQCILLEAREIGSGSTGNATGILSVGYETILSKVKSSFKEDKVKTFLNFGNLGMQNIRENIEKYGIECDFENKDLMIYAGKDHWKALEKEVEFANKVGLPMERFGFCEDNKTERTQKRMPENLKLPSNLKEDCYHIGILNNMAQFNPLAYTYGIAKAFVKEGGAIYEHSRVVDVKEESEANFVHLEDGSSIVADNVIIATHLPILDRSGHFSLDMKCTALYQVILPLSAPQGDETYMYTPIDISDFDGKTIRFLDGGKAVSITGFPHPLGDMTAVKDIDPFEELRVFGVENLGVDPEAKPLGKFFDFDYMSPDSLPYIGRLSKSSKSIYTATGFSQWGFLMSAAAPVHIMNLMNNTQTEYDLFDATRWSLKGLGQSIKGKTKVIKHLIGDRIKSVFKSPINCEDLKPGEGGECVYEGKTRGGHKNIDGTMCIVDLSCTHLDCVTTYNRHAKTYDCGCHGSRFNLKGEVISGPAVKNLTQLKCDFTQEAPSLDILGKEDQREEIH